MIRVVRQMLNCMEKVESIVAPEGHITRAKIDRFENDFLQFCQFSYRHFTQQVLS